MHILVLSFASPATGWVDDLVLASGEREQLMKKVREMHEQSKTRFEAPELEESGYVIHLLVDGVVMAEWRIHKVPFKEGNDV
mgnify:CR=1 FL=1